jgi:hypothetical protein
MHPSSSSPSAVSTLPPRAGYNSASSRSGQHRGRAGSNVARSFGQVGEVGRVVAAGRVSPIGPGALRRARISGISSARPRLLSRPDQAASTSARGRSADRHPVQRQGRPPRPSRSAPPTRLLPGGDSLLVELSRSWLQSWRRARCAGGPAGRAGSSPASSGGGRAGSESGVGRTS